MAVRPESIENQERGLNLRNRDQRSREAPETDAPPPPASVVATPAAAELRELRARLAAVEATPPPDTSPHCRDCFLRGVRAAARAIRGE